jgi:4-amino-4-deoxy-L-arabinose transferase-like glycosyltransferase
MACVSLLPAREINFRLAWRRIFFLVTIWTIVLAAYNAIRQLVPDEAYYWTWSRHLAGGYLDHPPMVALMIRAGTAIFGHNEFGVRFFAAILAAGTALAVAITAGRLSGPRAALWAVIILLCSPAVAAMAMIITPDTPGCFFAAGTLLAAVSVFLSPPNSTRRTIWWLALGTSMGLALLSKYTTVLIGVAIATAIFSTAQGRSELKRPGIWLALLMAVVAFSPTIIWNAAHNWASFRFQLSHGLGEDEGSRALSFLGYLPGQAVVWTPVLLAVTLIALVHFWRRLRDLDVVDRILLFSATLPLVFFWYSSSRHHVEPNWPTTAYLPATILLIRYIQEKPAGRRRQWTEIGVVIAACATIILHVPELWALTPGSWRMPGKWGDLFAWRDLARQVDAVAPPGSVVYCSSYESAAEITFYRSGHHPAWLLDSGRPSAYDYFDPPPPDPAAQTAIVYVRNGPHFISPADGPPPYGPPLVMTRNFRSMVVQWHEYRVYGHSVRFRQFIIARR